MSDRITVKQLDEAAEMMSRHTGRTLLVKPFPAPGANGYNLVEIKPGVQGESIVRGGMAARALFAYLHAYTEGFRAARDAADAKLIRFYGQEASLKKWQGLVQEITHKAGSPIHVRSGRFCYTVMLTNAERDILQARLWYAESGTGNLATGHPYKWNDCIAYEDAAEGN